MERTIKPREDGKYDVVEVQKSEVIATRNGLLSFRKAMIDDMRKTEEKIKYTKEEIAYVNKILGYADGDFEPKEFEKEAKDQPIVEDKKPEVVEDGNKENRKHRK